MKYEAILFDLDGTLLNTLEDLGNSMNSVLERHRFPLHALEAYRYFVGDGIENLVLRAVPAGNRDPKTLTDCLEAMKEEYGRRWMEKTQPYPGIPQLLDELVRRSIKMAIFSNKQDELTQIAVEKFLSKWPFEMVAGARASAPKKPDPSVPLAMAQKMGVAPEASLYVGDTNTDMKTAKAAGMHAVGVLWGFRDADELLMNGARVLVKEPSEILQLL